MVIGYWIIFFLDVFLLFLDLTVFFQTTSLSKWIIFRAYSPSLKSVITWTLSHPEYLRSLDIRFDITNNFILKVNTTSVPLVRVLEPLSLKEFRVSKVYENSHRNVVGIWFNLEWKVNYSLILVFKVIFLCQKSTESFWFFWPQDFSLGHRNLFLLLPLAWSNGLSLSYSTVNCWPQIQKSWILTLTVSN